MLNRKELRHSLDLIGKTEARLSYQRRLASLNLLDEKLQLLSGELIDSMERRLSHMQLQHESLLANRIADDQTTHHALTPSRQSIGGFTDIA